MCERKRQRLRRKELLDLLFLRGLKKKKLGDMLTNADENDETNEQDQPLDDEQH